jgi:copper ion binding protein
MSTLIEHVTVTAPDMSCGHCEAAIKEAVGALPGVVGVAADAAAKRVEIDFDPDRVTMAQIETALDEVGYPVQR